MIPTNSVSAPSTLSIPASTEMTSELGWANFLDSTLAKNTLSVYPTRHPSAQHPRLPARNQGQRTSSACTSDPWRPPLTAPTALPNRSRVCTSRCRISVGPGSSSMAFSAGRSGRRRKNSVQKPSDFSGSSPCPPRLRQYWALKCSVPSVPSGYRSSWVSRRESGTNLGASVPQPATPKPYHSQRGTNLEERLVKLHNLGLKHFRRRLPRQRRRLHSLSITAYPSASNSLAGPVCGRL